MRVVRVAIFGYLLTAPAAGGPPDPLPPLPDDQQQAVKAIERMRGFAVRDSKTPGQPVVDVSFYSSVSDADLDVLDRFPELKVLWIRGGGLTDTGLARLAVHRHLSHLELDYCDVSDAGLAVLADFPKLERLGVENMPITDAGLAHLAKCPRLRVIQFYDTEVSEEGIDRLKEAMPCALISVFRRDRRSDDSEPVGPFWWVVVVVGLGGGTAVWLYRSRWAPARRWRWS
jgi:hypothetical protein